MRIFHWKNKRLNLICQHSPQNEWIWGFGCGISASLLVPEWCCVVWQFPVLLWVRQCFVTNKLQTKRNCCKFSFWNKWNRQESIWVTNQTFVVSNNDWYVTCLQITVNNLHHHRTSGFRGLCDHSPATCRDQLPSCHHRHQPVAQLYITKLSSILHVWHHKLEKTDWHQKFLNQPSVNRQTSEKGKTGWLVKNHAW